jgi:hypothetical protein
MERVVLVPHWDKKNEILRVVDSTPPPEETLSVVLSVALPSSPDQKGMSLVDPHQGRPDVVRIGGGIRIAERQDVSSEELKGLFIRLFNARAFEEGGESLFATFPESCRDIVPTGFRIVFRGGKDNLYVLPSRQVAVVTLRGDYFRPSINVLGKTGEWDLMPPFDTREGLSPLTTEELRFLQETDHVVDEADRSRLADYERTYWYQDL